MNSSLEETLWSLVDALSKRTNCKKRAVGCIIYNTKLQEVVAKGWNIHLDGVCDCLNTEGKKGTAQHAEITALHDMLGPYKREDLILFVNHAPCANCKSEIETVVHEVRYRSQK